MSTESVIEKIKKLLNMTESNGCTEAEAKRALTLAHKLLAEHNISMGQLNASEQEEITKYYL